MSNWKDALNFATHEMGFESRSKFREVFLPSWWSDSIADTKEGFDEGIQLLANALSVRPAQILAREKLTPGGVPIRCKGDSQKTMAAQGVGIALVRHLVDVFSPAAKVSLRSAEELHDELLAGGQVISLSRLIDWCWENGIAVAHAGRLPSPKPHAIATNIDNRCGIVLMRNLRHRGWHLFDLAHEIGHIMSGHLEKEEAICDSENTDLNTAMELEANSYAFQLLTGTPLFSERPGIYKAIQLIETGKHLANKWHVDPQWIMVAITATNQSKSLAPTWEALSAALKLEWPNDNAPEKINVQMQGYLRESEFSTTSLSLIESMTRSPK